MRFAGMLPDEERLHALEAATVVVVPSPYESLSLLALEAFAVGTPVLANARAEVLVEHCRRSNAGPVLRGSLGVRRGAEAAAEGRAAAEAMGRNGKAYINRHYRWSSILGKYERLFTRLAAAAPSRSAIANASARPDRVTRGPPARTSTRHVRRSPPRRVRATAAPAGPRRSARRSSQHAQFARTSTDSREASRARDTRATTIIGVSRVRSSDVRHRRERIRKLDASCCAEVATCSSASPWLGRHVGPLGLQNTPIPMRSPDLRSGFRAAGARARRGLRRTPRR